MSTEGPLLDAEQIRALLTELGARLHARGIEARVFLVGGAAMALAYNARRATRDLDGVFEPKVEIYAEAATMAEERELPADWLNDGVKDMLPDLVGAMVGTYFDSAGIAVEVASAEYLFAMKAFAAREEVDADDLTFLARHLGLRSAEEAVDLVERFYSPRRLKPVTRYLLEDIFSELDADGGPAADLDGGDRVSPYRRKDGTTVSGHRRGRRPGAT